MISYVQNEFITTEAQRAQRKDFFPGRYSPKKKPLERAVNLREREKGDKG